MSVVFSFAISFDFSLNLGICLFDVFWGLMRILGLVS